MKYSASFQFEGGTLTVKRSGYGEKNGCATLAFKDSDLEYEYDGADMATRWIEIARSEAIAIRDFLNKEYPPEPLKMLQQVENAVVEAFDRMGRVFEEGQARELAAAAIAAMREPTPEIIGAAAGIFPERAVRMVWERQIDAALLSPLTENQVTRDHKEG